MSSSKPQRLRPLLPKSPQTRPEPFLVKCTLSVETNRSMGSQEVKADVHPKRREQSGSEFERRSLGKKRRSREAKENEHEVNILHAGALQLSGLGGNENLPWTSKNYYIPEEVRMCDLELKPYEGELRKGERHVEANPDCDPTQALNRALDLEYEANEPRRRDRYRGSYRSQMLRYLSEH
ncbi:hypothetical protein B0H13DRAFT_1864429 [Mycena leptocephala]|nr:hypothetical protein B0H13DRAFT_1864429 [Mycena leptocephala]